MKKRKKKPPEYNKQHCMLVMRSLSRESLWKTPTT